MKKIQLIDLVRTFSILAVMAHHLGLPFITTASQPHLLAVLWFKLWANGYYGVSMFFVISGFLITRVIATQPGGLFNPDFRDFYARRAGRIFPLLALICLLGFVLNGIVPNASPGFGNCLKMPSGPQTWLFWLSILTFTENWFKIFIEPHGYNLSLHWAVLWSLAIEEQFYLFYPLILKRLGNPKNLVIFLSIIVLSGPFSMILGSFFWHKYPFLVFNPATSYNSFAGFGLIALGCLLHLAAERYETVLSRRPKVCWWLCLAGLFILLFIYPHINVSIDFEWYVFGGSAMGAGLFLFLLGGMHLDFFNRKGWRILSLPGKFSYGGYLYHSAILFLLWPLLTGMNEFQAFFFFACVTTIWTWISYRYYEMPMNAFIRKGLGSSTKV